MTVSEKESPWPLRGYAPGGYVCICSLCEKQFMGDKRAYQCLLCAVRLTNEALSSLVSAPAQEGWRTIETAPKDGTKIDLWCINHLHYAKSGQRVVNVAWGPVRDWMGNEREDWCHGFGEDLEPTHWMSLPAAPASPEQGGE